MLQGFRKRLGNDWETIGKRLGMITMVEKVHTGSFGALPGKWMEG